MKTVIIGGGPGGYTAALESANHGLETILISDSTGGLCLHKGCIPTKMFLHNKGSQSSAAEILTQFRNIETDSESGIRYSLKKAGVKLIEGHASIGSDGLIYVNDLYIEYDTLIISTGSVPYIPDFPNNDKYRFYDTAFYLDRPDSLPDEICIMGGGPVGIEIAVILNNMGVKVSVTEKENEILHGSDPFLAGKLRAMLKEQGISFYMNQSIPVCRDVMCCCGRVPLLPDGYENLKLSGKRKIFEIGDCTGKSSEAADAMHQAHCAVSEIAGISASSYKHIPAHCIHTSPELAWTGLNRNSDKSVTVSFSEITSARIYKEHNSFMKMFFDPVSSVITSFHILSDNASQMICTAQMILYSNMKVTELSHFLFPHPTVSEIFTEAALRAEKKLCI